MGKAREQQLGVHDSLDSSARQLALPQFYPPIELPRFLY